LLNESCSRSKRFKIAAPTAMPDEQRCRIFWTTGPLEQPWSNPFLARFRGAMPSRHNEAAPQCEGGQAQSRAGQPAMGFAYLLDHLGTLAATRPACGGARLHPPLRAERDPGDRPLKRVKIDPIQ